MERTKSRGLLLFLAGAPVLGVFGWAQKGKPPPPAPAHDPAIVY